jgi:hypothetical protein
MLAANCPSTPAAAAGLLALFSAEHMGCFAQRQSLLLFYVQGGAAKSEQMFNHSIY